MNDRQHSELLDALLDLRNATELGFQSVNGRMDQMDERWDRRFAALERRMDETDERWDQRHSTLETRVDGGFRELSESFAGVVLRLTSLEQR